MFFIIDGVYEVSLYPNSAENRSAMEGLFILMASFGILSGDFILRSIRSSIPLLVLGSTGILVSVMGLLVPTIMSGMMKDISVFILLAYSLVFILGPIM